ncbi:MAG: oligosaccharide flippase family protein [Ruminiclostridium sp.]|nr:oligosaccharide flippase family protein [Ruminiclostridium sp.]
MKKTNAVEMKKIMVKDTALFLPAKIIEGLIGLVTITLYTKFFVPEIYGYYGFITTTVNIMSFLLLGWLIQSVYRYVNSFDGGKKQVLFYSTSFTLWCSINGIILILGLLGVFFIGKGNEPWVTQLYVLSLLMFITYNTMQIFTSLLSATRRTKLLLFTSIFSVAAKLLFTVFFVYQYKTNTFTPAAAVLSNVLVDTFIIVLIGFRLKITRYIRFSFFSSKVLKKFFAYGMPLVLVNITNSLLSLSDRYVITSFAGAEQLGVYHANYTISSTLFTLILSAVMRGVFPVILRNWRQNTKEQTEHLLSQAVRYYLMISLPALFGLSMLSKTVSSLFLDPAYFEDGFVIIWVAAGMFFFGLAEYSNKAWELNQKTRPLFFNSLISSLVNVLINLLLVPVYGYRIAAISTALAYFLYLMLSLLRGRKILKINFNVISVAKILFSCILMSVVVTLLLRSFTASVPVLVLIVLTGCAVYFASLFVLKELQSEINAFMNWLKKKGT